MRRRTAALALLVALLFPSPPGTAGEEGEKWEKDGSKGGVTVYTRPVEGSEIKEIKGIATVDTSTDRVWEHLVTDKTFLKTMPDVVKSKKIEDCGDTCVYYYQVLHHPPIKDRHYVLKIEWQIKEKDGQKSYRRWWRVSKDVAPPASGPLLVEKMDGAWNLTPKEGGKKTLIVYRNHIEMGGKVPVAILNPAAVSNAYGFLKNLKAAFKK